jgi:SSS family solute:Na+ symporter
VFVGFFAAVIFGTVLSTYNSVLNSSITIFALDVYKPLWGRHLDDAVIIRHAKWVGSLLVLFTMLIAPLIMRFEEGIFQYMVKTEILFGSPLFLVLLVGFFSQKVSTRAANVTLVSYLVTLALFQHVLDVPLHFLHILAILFVLHAGLFFALSRVWPNRRPIPVAPEVSDIDLKPWRWFPHVSAAAIATMIATYVIFSPLGLAEGSPDKQIDYGFIAGGLVLAAAIFGIPWRIHVRNRRAAIAAGADGSHEN